MIGGVFAVGSGRGLWVRRLGWCLALLLPKEFRKNFDAQLCL